MIRVRAAHLTAGGGMSRNALLIQLMADATGLPLQRATEAESTGLGCAILVAAGAGVHADVATAARAMCRFDSIAPDRERHERCARGFAKWRELYDNLETMSL